MLIVFALVSIASIIFNFNSYLMGNTVEITHFVVSFVYVIVNIALITKVKDTKTMNRFLLFIWIITGLTLGFMLAVNFDPLVMNKPFMWIIVPFALLFVTPLYGFEYFFPQIITLISWLLGLSILLVGYGLYYTIRNSK